MRQSIKVNTALFEASSYIKIDCLNNRTKKKKDLYLKYSKQENANYDGKVHANQVSSLLVKSAILFLDVINVGINDIPCPKRIRRSS